MNNIKRLMKNRKGYITNIRNTHPNRNRSHRRCSSLYVYKRNTINYD